MDSPSGISARRDREQKLRARQARQEESETARFLAGRFLDMPGLARVLVSIYFDAAESARGSGDKARVRAEASLRSLQLFDYATRLPAGTVRGPGVYAEAAGIVWDTGDVDGAAILAGFAGQLSGIRLGSREEPLFGEEWEEFGESLASHHQRWAGRHRDWQRAAPAGPSPWVPLGRARRGADGAFCTPARTEGTPGGSRHAVVMRAGGGREEIIAFVSQHAAARWLASRALTAGGPLLTTADGPASRTAREEEILARMVRDPGDARLRALVDENTFTTHLRAELYRALTRYGPDRRSGFADAMLRAPGWALREIGWPHAHRAMRYLDRLAATPVTVGQARAAAHAVAAAQEPDDSRRPGTPLAAPPRPRRTPARAARPAASPRPAVLPGALAPRR